jgi:Ner family transcriptional regulator
VARTPCGWHPEDIKAELRKRHGPITKLSLEWGHARNAITHTLRDPNHSKRVELKIAEALDVSPHVLWPARWSTDGTPLPRSIDFDPIPGARVRNSQNQKAA